MILFYLKVKYENIYDWSKYIWFFIMSSGKCIWFLLYKLWVLIEMCNSKNLFDVILLNNYEMSEYYCNVYCCKYVIKLNV